ncbi:transporter [Halofilum ochraceum]|uniref:transporter n=1 Tax=Halofilum ochraceum TaxID=1611323 RepID=UPI000832DD28|nr:transporter [Halofilum ochraceum]
MERTVAASILTLTLTLPFAGASAQESDSGGEPSASGSAAPTEEEAEPESSVRDVYREQHALFGEDLTIEPSITWTHSDRNQLTLSGFLALDAIFLGNISVDRIARDTIQPEVAMRYDLTDRFQFQLAVPYVFRQANYESTNQEGDLTLEETVSDDDIGDTRMRLFYRWLDETQNQPDVVLNLGVTAPTGTDPFGIPTASRGDGLLTFPEELPTGNGVWTVSLGASILKTYDPAIVFASFGADVRLKEEFDDISAQSGDQPGEIDLGDSFRFGLGTAFALNRDLSLSFSLDQKFTSPTEQKLEGQASQEITGSDSVSSVLNLGATLNLGPDRSLTTNVGFGLTDDAPDVSLRMAMPFSM